MLTSPVFTAAARQHGRQAARLHRSTAYPSFTRTLLQTRDLLVWLCVKIGLLAAERRHELMEVLTELAQLYARMASSTLTPTLTPTPTLTLTMTRTLALILTRQAARAPGWSALSRLSWL
jgi:hypothetical protein